MDLHDIEAAHALQTLGQSVPDTQLNTEDLMAELSNEVQFREATGVGVAQSTRPEVAACT